MKKLIKILWVILLASIVFFVGASLWKGDPNPLIACSIGWAIAAIVEWRKGQIDE